MNQPPAFQFYPDDFLGGTVIMNNCERGLYISLLCLQWSKGAVTQTDIDRIATPSFGGDVAIVIAKFKQVSEGIFRNERMEKERKKQLEFREACSSAGKSGASKRWGGHSDPIKTLIGKNSSPISYLLSSDKKGTVLQEVEAVFNGWNSLKRVSKCLILSDKRRRTLEFRLHGCFFRDNWRPAMAKVQESEFCTGNNDRGWKADFDWFIRPDTVAKIMEGKYDSKQRNGPVKVW